MCRLPAAALYPGTLRPVAASWRQVLPLGMSSRMAERREADDALSTAAVAAVAAVPSAHVRQINGPCAAG